MLADWLTCCIAERRLLPDAPFRVVRSQKLGIDHFFSSGDARIADKNGKRHAICRSILPGDVGDCGSAYGRTRDTFGLSNGVKSTAGTATVQRGGAGGDRKTVAVNRENSERSTKSTGRISSGSSVMIRIENRAAQHGDGGRGRSGMDRRGSPGHTKENISSCHPSRSSSSSAKAMPGLESLLGVCPSPRSKGKKRDKEHLQSDEYHSAGRSAAAEGRSKIPRKAGRQRLPEVFVASIGSSTT